VGPSYYGGLCFSNTSLVPPSRQGSPAGLSEVLEGWICLSWSYPVSSRGRKSFSNQSQWRNLFSQRASNAYTHTSSIILQEFPLSTIPDSHRPLVSLKNCDVGVTPYNIFLSVDGGTPHSLKVITSTTNPPPRASENHERLGGPQTS
jgi:hypothetical protein